MDFNHQHSLPRFRTGASASGPRSLEVRKAFIFELGGCYDILNFFGEKNGFFWLKTKLNYAKI
jgi:hypothetical protein